MTLSNRMSELVQACFSGIWIQSHEHQDAILELTRLSNEQNWHLALWNINQGLSLPGDVSVEEGTTDPLAAVNTLGSLSSDKDATLLVLENFHAFLKSPEIIQAVANAVIAGKTNRQFVVILSPVVQIPVELEKLLVVIEHQLPTRGQLEEIAQGIATEEGELPKASRLDALLDASSGLTRLEAENAFSLSLVRHGKLESSAVWEMKSQTMSKTGTLSLHRGDDDFSSLGGLSALKAFTKRALLQRSGTESSNRRIRPKGVMLLSPPGCGKSAFCKALGNEVGRPVLILDVGSLMGSLVGQSEERTRQALATIDAMAPAIVMIDEVEKAFAGAGGGQNDSGVSSRMFGTFLSWLNDHESDVFVVCTANNVSRLPPEFSRAERFDAVFFVDLPEAKEKQEIWDLYLKQYQLDPDQELPVDQQWTGAEIRSCCRLAALLDVPLLQAAQNDVPVAVTSSESVAHLRQWASGRCLAASSSGIYRQATAKEGKRRRSISPKPSLN